MIIKINKNKFDKFFKILKGNYDVFAPIGDGMNSKFSRVKSIKEINLDISNTDKSPKEIFFPQTEILFNFESQKINLNAEKNKSFAVWGMRPCDAKSLTLIDKIFGSAKQKPNDENFEDPYWKSKYDDALIFSIGCNTPASTCFCNWFESGPFEKIGSDIFVVNTDEYYLMEAVSEKGKVFLKKVTDFEKGIKKDEEKITELKKRAESYLKKSVDLKALDNVIEEIWGNPVWDELSNKCINCGACTFICPTCHCFDIQDEGKEKAGKRIRLWDSCMFPDFTGEASGHNPRLLSKDRFRQRFMHKFKYFPDNNDDYLCTGCGRCIYVCPVNVDIREVVEKIVKCES
ncbi:MAG: 4Fe-4S dicluster domain-containing protein [Candidatus Marinimicrobia bacterium]|nr:4Fe-4S dicluster domain-containing protein [Candidatus Neomarinimicrobiota bacterium]